MTMNRPLTLDELEARGAAAFAETRRMIREMLEMAETNRRIVKVLGRSVRARHRMVVREPVAPSAKT